MVQRYIEETEHEAEYRASPPTPRVGELALATRSISPSGHRCTQSVERSTRRSRFDADTTTEWKETYDVETPGKLEASIADIDDPEERTMRREIASEWEQLADRIPVIRAALNEYEWAADRDALPV